MANYDLYGDAGIINSTYSEIEDAYYSNKIIVATDGYGSIYPLIIRSSDGDYTFSSTTGSSSDDERCHTNTFWIGSDNEWHKSGSNDSSILTDTYLNSLKITDDVLSGLAKKLYNTEGNLNSYVSCETKRLTDTSTSVSPPAIGIIFIYGGGSSSNLPMISFASYTLSAVSTVMLFCSGIVHVLYSSSSDITKYTPAHTMISFNSSKSNPIKYVSGTYVTCVSFSFANYKDKWTIDEMDYL